MAKNRNMASPCGGPAIANVNHNSAQTTLSPVFPNVDSMDIEDILCIHKKQLAMLP